MDRYQQTLETWNNLVDIYQDKFMKLDLYDDTYDRFCELIQKADANVLEIGCGPGNVTHALLTRRPDYKMLVTDLAPAMVERAKENNPSVEAMVLDCRNVDILDDKYDGIMCGFCMPYLSKDDCRNLIHDCASLLNTGGVLYCSALEGDYDTSAQTTSGDGKHSVFVYNHEQSYLKQFMEDNGFVSIEVWRKPYPGPNGTTSTHLILMAVKK